MATVKINNKRYEVPELTFRHFTMMEEQGFSLLEAFRKKQIMLLAMAFVVAVTGEDRDEAERLIEQHVLGGGDLEPIYTAFAEAIDRSGFFKRMLGQQTPEKTEKKQKTQPIKEESKAEGNKESEE